MIQRNEIHPETIQACLDFASKHEEEIEALIDNFLLKWKNNPIKPGEFFVVPVTRFSIRAVNNICVKYSVAGWGVLLTSSSRAIGTSLELRITW